MSGTSVPTPTAGLATEATLSGVASSLSLGTGGWLGVSIEAGSISLPPGIATSANQTTEIASLASIDGGVAALSAQLPASLGTGGWLGISVESGSVAVSGGTVIADQGAPAPLLTDAWPMMLTDGIDVAGLSTVGGGVALKVDVVQTVGGGGGGTSSPFGAAAPATGTAAGFVGAGGLMQAARVHDLDSGAGAEQNLGISIRLSAPGGSVEGGTGANPLRVDPTGTTAQPVTDAGGSLTVDTAQLPAALVGGRLSVDGSGVTQPVSAAALPLPAGAATETTLATRATEATLANVLTTTAFQARVATLGQKAMAGSMPVAIASDQGAVPVSVGGSVAVTGPLTDAQLRAAAVSVSGPLTDAQLRASAVAVGDGGGSLTVDAPVGTPVAARLSDGAAFYDAVKTGQLPAALVGARLDTNNGAWLGSTAPSVGQKTMAASLPVTLALDQSTIPVALSLTNGGTASNPVYVKSQAADPVFVVFGAPPDVNIDTWLGSASPTVGQKAMAASIPVVLASDQSAIPAPALTKGTQGSTGFSVQDLKDAGRVLKTFIATAVATVTSEALITLTPYSDLSVGANATSFAVTAGKRLRIQSITVTVRATSTVNVGGVVRFRMLSGAVLVGSPVHQSIACMASELATAVAGNAKSFQVVFPDGLELSGTMQFGLTQFFSATSATIDVQVVGFEY